MNKTHEAVLLFSKHWYERPEGYPNNGIAAFQESRVEDLQYILSILYGFDCDREHVWNILVEIFMEYVSPREQTNFLTKIFYNNAIFSEFTDNANYAKAVADILSKLSITKVQGNPKMEGLGKPDYEMFPKLAKKKE